MGFGIQGFALKGQGSQLGFGLALENVARPSVALSNALFGHEYMSTYVLYLQMQIYLTTYFKTNYAIMHHAVLGRQSVTSLSPPLVLRHG